MIDVKYYYIEYSNECYDIHNVDNSLMYFIVSMTEGLFFVESTYSLHFISKWIIVEGV